MTKIEIKKELENTLDMLEHFHKNEQLENKTSINLLERLIKELKELISLLKDSK